MGDALVVGYGNDLRGDDGAGRWVADQVEALVLDHVDVISRVQLVPELALELADRRVVVIVDASVDADDLVVTVLAPATRTGAATHHGDPGAVLAMASHVGALPKEAFLVSIPASEFDLGFDFSTRTQVAATEAVSTVTALVQPRG